MQTTSDQLLRSVAAPDADRSAAHALFPLRFTPFELYFHLEDRPNFPSVFPVRLECRGPFSAECFQRAYELTCLRHPLLAARIESQGRRRPTWVPGEPAAIVWADASEGLEGAFRNLDPAARLRVHVFQDGDRTVLSFLFHHVAIDGLGAFGFISDLMVAYAHFCAGEAGEPPWRALNRDLLRDRDGYRLLNRQWKWMDLARVARISVETLFRRAAVVSDLDRPAPTRQSGAASDFLLHTLSPLETAALTRTASKLSVRLNDLLIRDYFLLLADWNRDTPEARRPIRLLVPTNLRRKQDYRMPAANVFGYAFLTRRPSACRDRTGLLDSIRDEMAAIKRTRRGVHHEAGMRMFAAWPWLLRWSLERKWPFATAVFTNLNAGFDHVPLPWRDGRRVAGDLVVEAGYGAGPLRPETRVSLAIHNYAGNMSISVRCDEQALGPKSQEAVLQAYLGRLRQSVQSET